jgi:hypothetical protein
MQLIAAALGPALAAQGTPTASQQNSQVAAQADPSKVVVTLPASVARKLVAALAAQSSANGDAATSDPVASNLTQDLAAAVAHWTQVASATDSATVSQASGTSSPVPNADVQPGPVLSGHPAAGDPKSGNLGGTGFDFIAFDRPAAPAVPAAMAPTGDPAAASANQAPAGSSPRDLHFDWRADGEATRAVASGAVPAYIGIPSASLRVTADEGPSTHQAGASPAHSPVSSLPGQDVPAGGHSQGGPSQDKPWGLSAPGGQATADQRAPLVGAPAGTQIGSGAQTLAAIANSASIPQIAGASNAVSNVFLAKEASLSQPSDSLAQPSIGDQLADGLRAGMGNAGAAGQQITISLTPPELGNVRLVVQSNGDAVSCVMHVQNPATLDQIRDQAPALVGRLAQDGVEVRRMDVVLDKAANDHQQRQPDSQLQPARQWDSSSYGTFRDPQSGRQDSYGQNSRRGNHNASPRQPDAAPQDQTVAIAAAPAAYVRDGSINTLI